MDNKTSAHKSTKSLPILGIILLMSSVGFILGKKYLIDEPVDNLNENTVSEFNSEKNANENSDFETHHKTESAINSENKTLATTKFSPEVNMMEELGNLVDDHSIHKFFDKIYMMGIDCINRNDTCYLESMEFFEYHSYSGREKVSEKASFLLASLQRYLENPLLGIENEMVDNENLLNIEMQPTELKVETSQELQDALENIVYSGYSSGLARSKMMNQVNMAVLGAVSYNSIEDLDMASIRSLVEESKPVEEITSITDRYYYQAWLTAMKITDNEGFSSFIVDELSLDAPPSVVVDLVSHLYSAKDIELPSSLKESLQNKLEESRQDIVNYIDEEELDETIHMLGIL